MSEDASNHDFINDTNGNNNGESFGAQVVRAIRILADLQTYTPSYASHALEKVLGILHAILPLSPPPETNDEPNEEITIAPIINRKQLTGASIESSGGGGLTNFQSSSGRGGGLSNVQCSSGGGLSNPQSSSGVRAVRRSIGVQPEPDILGDILSPEKVLSKFGSRTSSNLDSNEAHSHEPTSKFDDAAVVGRPVRSSLISERFSLPNVRVTNMFGWNFDIFGLEQLTSNRPLVYLGIHLFNAFNLPAVFKTSIDVLGNWLLLMEANYHQFNPYHNATHAADVLQATAYFLKTERLSNYLEPIEQALCLIAAAIHDLDHPGKTNSFLLVTRHELALLYNDKAILESHHVAFAFKLTLSDPRVNIFENLDTATYRHVRTGIVDTVLATEMVHHYQHVTAFTAALKANYPTIGAGSKVAPGDTDPFKTDPNIILTRRMLIKCSDVSNPCRPLRLTCEWALRICEEFFNETEEEIKLGIQLTLPYFVRDSCSLPAAQAGFNDFFTLNLLTPWHEFLQVHEVMKHLRENDAFWRKLIADGVITAAQVLTYFHEKHPGDDPVL